MALVENQRGRLRHRYEETIRRLFNLHVTPPMAKNATPDSVKHGDELLETTAIS